MLQIFGGVLPSGVDCTPICWVYLWCVPGFSVVSGVLIYDSSPTGISIYFGLFAGHGLFAVKDVQLIPLPHGHTRASGREQQAERRYRKLITSGLDLSKDFLVSYSYNLCHTVQTNLTKPLSDPFDSRFVWNEYLTRDFRPKVSLTTFALEYSEISS